MAKRDKESMRFSTESILSIYGDRKRTLIEDMKNLIKDLLHNFGKENDGEWVLDIKNPDEVTIHFLNADNEHLHVTPTVVYTNDYDEIGVYGKDGNYNQEDFEDVAFYSELLALMYNSIFFGK